MELKTGYLLAGGRYRIERVLGHGGFGITYLAEQVSLGRNVAVKEFFMREYCERAPDSFTITLGSSGSREMVNRYRDKFIKEARALAKLRHRHIVRIIDVFEENNTAYYVMEYIAGGSLGDKAKGAALPEGDAVRYIHQVASALDYVHSRHMMHLDVKPSNILLNSDGEAILIDFGLSKQYDMSGEQTSSTPVGISHGYAPMEQYKRGGVGTFSPATDIYSLGATLYKLVTGLTPPEANDVADEGLPALPQHLSVNLRAAIEASMQFRRKDRPQSIGEFLEIVESGKLKDESGEMKDDSDGVEDCPPAFRGTSAAEGVNDSRVTDDGETVVGPVIAAKRSAEESQFTDEEILDSVQDDKGAKKEKSGNGNEKSAAGVISNDSEKSHPNNGKPSNKKWIAIVAVALLVVTALIIGVNWYGDYRAAEAERRQAEIALAEQQAEQQRLEEERIAKERADSIAAEQHKVLIPFLDDNDKYGFVDKSGNIAIECKYDFARSFSEGLARVRIDGKYGFIDKLGNEVIGFKYDFAVPFSEGLASVKKNGKMGFIDKSGNIAIECKYDYAGSFSEGLASVKKNGKWGFIDKSGNIAIECKYDYADSFSEGLAPVKKNGKRGFIDKSGNIAIECKYDYAHSFSEGLAPVEKNGKWGFIDKSGNIAIECKYDYADSFSEGLANVGIDGKYGFIDKLGNVIIECECRFAGPFGEGLARVDKAKGSGFIDRHGNVIIECKYSQVLRFNKEGIARVRNKDGKWIYIDKSGKEYIKR